MQSSITSITINALPLPFGHWETPASTSVYDICVISCSKDVLTKRLRHIDSRAVELLVDHLRPQSRIASAVKLVWADAYRKSIKAIGEFQRQSALPHQVKKCIFGELS